MATLDTINEFLKKFRDHCRTHPGPIDGTWHLPSAKNKKSPHLLVLSCVHGDEVGSLPGLLEWMKLLLNQLDSINVTVVLGNIPAIESQVRYIHYDLNRYFSWDLEKVKLHKPDEMNFEISRAHEICSLIENCDYFLDLHQTIEPTLEPFYVMSDSPSNRLFANYLSSATKAVLKKGKMDDIESVTAFGFNRNKIGLTLELSQKGFNSEAEKLTLKCLKKAYEFSKSFSSNLSPDLISNSLNNFSQFNSPSTIEWLEVQNYVRFDGPLCQLNPGWQNFSKVTKGQVLGKKNDGSNLISPQDGYALFPKYISRDLTGYPIKIPPRDIITICGTESAI